MLTPQDFGRGYPAIAIIGVGCRFPGGAHDADGLWDLLVSGADPIADIPPDRWNAAAYYEPEPVTPDRMMVRQGGFLEGPIDAFDAAFFGMTPREAASLDPQQRLLLEVTWEALENAGLPPSTTAGKPVGVFVGGFTLDSMNLQLSESNRVLTGGSTATGVAMSMLAARLSHAFDWRGPSFTVDTACSSSLVALHQACVALGRGECDLAVAGGVNAMFNPSTTMLMSKGRFLSPDARCRTFDRGANGYVRSEGAASVLLKPLADAVRDNDNVLAVIRGSAVNQDGRTPGVTVPSGEAQQAVIRRAFAEAGVDPRTVGYFEAHGTGTAVGDPVEAKAIGSVLTGSDRTHHIGSVKSNIGHTEAAAGMAGLIKAVLCVQRGQIPGNLHFESPNPAIPFDELRLSVPTGTTGFPDWPGPRRAAVNSFGFGGTNAHVVIEQAPPPPPLPADPETGDEAPLLLPLSARGPEALDALARSYRVLAEQPDGPSWREIATTAARTREHHVLRTFVVAANAAEAAAAFADLPAPRAALTGGVAFVYTGMGPQWWGMGQELLRTQPLFREVVEACDEVLARFGISMAEELDRPQDGSRLTSTLYAQVANFVVQAGLTALWRAWGVEPVAVVGHSVGEVAAAYAAGVYSLEDALTISYHRARLQSGLAGRGVMAVAGLSADEVRPLLVDGVEIAAVNSASTTTLSGDRAAMEIVGQRVPLQPLRVEVAYHSAQMDPIRDDLLEALATITPAAAGVPLCSTVSGGFVDGTGMDAGYWWRNVRQPVLFAQACRALLGEQTAVVLEVGPHPVLAGAIDEAIAESGRTGVERLASLVRNQPQRRQLQHTLGALYAAGADIAWENTHPGAHRRVALPTYPWQRRSHWQETRRSRDVRLGVEGPLLAGRATASATVLAREVELVSADLHYLGDHVVDGAVVFPGAGYVEAALATFADDTPCVLEDVEFETPLVLTKTAVTTLRVEHDPERRAVRMYSRETVDDEWVPHTRMRKSDRARPSAPPAVRTTLAELTAALPATSSEDVYADLTRRRLLYGPSFRAVEQVWCDHDTREIFVSLHTGAVSSERHRLHPALLDAALHAMTVGASTMAGAQDDDTYVPARITSVRYYRPVGETLWVHGRQRDSGQPGRLECDLTLVTDGGEVVAEFFGLCAQVLTRDQAAGPAEVRPQHYEHAWQLVDVEESADPDGSWLVLGTGHDADALAGELTARGADVRRPAPDEDWAAAAHGCRAVAVVDSGDPPAESACESVALPLRVAQDLPQNAAQLVLVTRGAQSTGDTDPTTNPWAASWWGFARAAAAERPDLRVRVVDHDGDHRALVHELGTDTQEDVALRASGRHVRRFVEADAAAVAHNVVVDVDRTPVELRAGGTLGELRFAAAARRDPGPGEVEIQVSHVGLNFKDVLKASGLLAAAAMEHSLTGVALGMECAGEVVRVGADVSGVRVGDLVFAHGADLFRSYATVEAVRVVPLPRTLTPAQAVTLLPVVTAHQALVRLAGLRRGERVLIHSAAGGVGLAAVRIALSLGAVVHATAGSDARRELLRAEGAHLVSDSRSTAFFDDVLAGTGGEGVDVVLNSLAGELMEKSVELLRPFGRFVELGKADLAADRPLRLAAFRRALSFHAFDYDQMMALRPDDVQQCMRDVAALHDDGVVVAVPVAELGPSSVQEAFRRMTGDSHAGKIAVRMSGDRVAVPASSMTEPVVRPQATYLITGGAGGLGLEVARWLADGGATHLVLVGRNGVTTEAAVRTVEELVARDVSVRVEKADVSDPAQVADLAARVRAEMPALRGIVHAAANFDDVVLADTTAQRLVTATRAKADGAWYLHHETLADDLDFFVLFSSLAAQLGSAATGNYATSNEFLNGLARYRRSLGLPAVSIGWGMVGEVGVTVARDGLVGDLLRRNGHAPMTPRRLITELDAVVRTELVEGTVAALDWRRWAKANPQLAALPRFESLVPAAGTSHAASETPQRLRAASRADRLALLPALVSPLLHNATGLPADQLAAEQAVDIDSLVAVELRVRLQDALGVSVPSVKMQRNLTVGKLVSLLADELENAPVRPHASGITTEEFVSADGTTIYGHLSLPTGSGPHPAVVVCSANPGGALDDEGRIVRVSEHEPLCQAGFAVFTVDHRGAPGHGPGFLALAEMGGAEVDDVLAARAHLAGHPAVDGDRISILGTSRGAYTALLAITREPSSWQACAVLMGFAEPALLLDRLAFTAHNPVPVPAETTRADVEAYFTDPRRRPLLALTPAGPPLLVVHGEADDVVPVEEATRIADGARDAGLAARLVTVADMGHDHQHAGPEWEEIWPDVAGFLAGSSQRGGTA
ncbi:SDR family NAD(P)-dependent oxidoreductase [Lentzea sp. NPDC059081]|uniref:SDR family NAD(P)-dependent oxidoreductase n=1 Tax=Lentzea sp. NPDC059081 TaxID=3346719 RepID=UPI0036AF3482